MKFLPLLWATLWHRKLRTLFTFCSVTVAFFLFGMLQGFNQGIDGLFDLLTTERLRIAGRVNNAALPLAHLRQIESVEGITAATPLTVLTGTFQSPDNQVAVLGVDIRAYFGTLYPPWVLVEEQIAAMERTRNGMVVGAITAEKQGWRLGDRIPLQSSLAQKNGATVWDFEIVGIYHVPNRPNWATSVLANYAYINEARAEGYDLSLQYIARVADPERYAEVATAIDELFANSAYQTVTRSEEDFVRVLLVQVGDINYLLNGVVAAVLFVLLFLTSNTMMLAVRERVPELAAMLTIGFAGTDLLVLVLAEILLLCLAAGGLGLGGAAMVFPHMMAALGPTVGLEGMRILPEVYGWGVAIIVLVALVSGLPPAVRALRLNIVDGLANR